MIEVDGEGHYKPIQFGGKDYDANKGYQTTIRHDNIKTEYCIANNICLIRIPYWERDNLETYLFEKLECVKTA